MKDDLVERGLEAYQLAQRTCDGDSAYERHIAGVEAVLAVALGRAATVAEAEGVYPELNIFAGGPEWYKHGRRIASVIRALAHTTGQEGGR